MSMKTVQKVAEVAKQHGHVAPHKSPFPAQARKDAEQNAQHNRDMDRVERLHLRGQKK
jgi:hypothetical protein